MDVTKLLGALAFVGVAALAPMDSYAAVFAGHLKTITTNPLLVGLEYRLNENADSVTIRVKGPSPSTAVVKTLTLGARSKGLNTDNWDKTNNSSTPVAAGVYSWEIEASQSSAGTGYSKTVDGSARENTFYGPSGVDTVKLTTSPLFGNVYIVNNGGTTSAHARPTGEGVYVLGNDLTDYTGQGDTSYSGGVSWIVSATSMASPNKCVVTPDADKLFISDYSDPHSGIWVMDTVTPSAAFTPLFSEAPGRLSSGLKNDSMHGSINTMAIQGFGANRVLYTVDEDLVDPVGAASAMTNSVWRYNVGTVTSNYASTRTVVYNDANFANLLQNSNNKLMIDPKVPGAFWISQYRGTDGVGVPSLIHFNGTAVDFNSGSKIPGVLNANNAAAAEISADGNLIAMGGVSYLKVLDVSDLNNVTVVYSDTAASGNVQRDVDFDPAGNILMVNNNTERIVYYSKLGPNSFVTPSPTNGNITVTGSAVDEWGLY